MNPFVKTARTAITSTIVAGSLATAALVFAPLAHAETSPLSATTTVNVRQGPNTTSAVLATLSSGDTVTQRGAEQDGWLPITYNGKDAWIQAQYVSSTTATTAAANTATAELTADAYVRTAADPNAWVLGTAHTGDKVGITGNASGDYTPVNFFGRAGWIATRLLSTPDTTVTTVKITKAISSDYLWVRTGESTAVQSIGMLYPGDTAQVTGDPVNGWVPILFNGKAAFVAANYSRYSSDPTVVALATKVDTAAKAATGTASAAAATTETAAATTTPTTSAPAQAAASTKYTTTAVNVRVGPSTDQQSVTVLQQNSQVSATGKTSGDWTEITYDGASRWINSQYLSDTKTAEAPAPAPALVASTKYTTTAVNVRVGPSTDQQSVTVLQQNSQVSATGKTSGDWTEITYDGASRWINSQYLSDTKTAEATSSNSSATSGASAVQTAINFAMSKLGGPYVWGGTGPVGYDCSGLMQAAYAAAGISLPRVTWDQVNAGTRVSVNNLQPGDLVFFYDNSHVGMYIGDGKIVNALNDDAGIVISTVSSMTVSAAVRVA